LAAVVTFWQLPEDEKDFLNFLLTTGNVMAIPTHKVKTKVELAPAPVLEYVAERDPAQLAMALEKHALQAVIELREWKGEKLYVLDQMRSSVVSYQRARIRDGNKLGQANLCAYWEYPNKAGTELFRKDPEFTKWAKRVLGWARKATTERVEYNGFPYRATKRVKEGVSQGRLEVAF
jgi:hypothetical protein